LQCESFDGEAAISQLIQEGFLIIKQGRGAFVAHNGRLCENYEKKLNDVDAFAEDGVKQIV